MYIMFKLSIRIPSPLTHHQIPIWRPISSLSTALLRLSHFFALQEVPLSITPCIWLMLDDGRRAVRFSERIAKSVPTPVKMVENEGLKGPAAVQELHMYTLCNQTITIIWHVSVGRNGRNKM